MPKAPQHKARAAIGNKRSPEELSVLQDQLASHDNAHTDCHPVLKHQFPSRPVIDIQDRYFKSLNETNIPFLPENAPLFGLNTEWTLKQALAVGVPAAFRLMDVEMEGVVADLLAEKVFARPAVGRISPFPCRRCQDKGRPCVLYAVKRELKVKIKWQHIELRVAACLGCRMDCKRCDCLDLSFIHRYKEGKQEFRIKRDGEVLQEWTSVTKWRCPCLPEGDQPNDEIAGALDQVEEVDEDAIDQNNSVTSIMDDIDSIIDTLDPDSLPDSISDTLDPDPLPDPSASMLIEVPEIIFISEVIKCRYTAGWNRLAYSPVTVDSVTAALDSLKGAWRNRRSTPQYQLQTAMDAFLPYLSFWCRHNGLSVPADKMPLLGELPVTYSDLVKMKEELETWSSPRVNSLLQFTSYHWSALEWNPEEFSPGVRSLIPILDMLYCRDSGSRQITTSCNLVMLRSQASDLQRSSPPSNNKWTLVFPLAIIDTSDLPRNQQWRDVTEEASKRIRDTSVDRFNAQLQLPHDHPFYSATDTKPIPLGNVHLIIGWVRTDGHAMACTIKCSSQIIQARIYGSSGTERWLQPMYQDILGFILNMKIKEEYGDKDQPCPSLSIEVIDREPCLLQNDRFSCAFVTTLICHAALRHAHKIGEDGLVTWRMTGASSHLLQQKEKLELQRNLFGSYKHELIRTKMMLEMLIRELNT